MKLTIVISSLLLQFIVGCGSATTSPVVTYIESQPSFYELLYNTATYQNIQWNKDSLSKTLTSSNSFVYPWFEDTEK